MNTKWRILPLPDKTSDAAGYLRAVRLNSLGNLYWFGKHTVGYTRFSTLHQQLCASLENEHLFLVMQVPMSHFKTRLGIALSIWWALPFTERDESNMRELGYGDAWIRYMRAIHDQNMRTLVCHEIAEQATAIGRDVDSTYENNDLFREVFQEIIPDRKCTWNNAHKFQRRLPGADSSTGTFEYRGVGQALQGIHAQGIIPDDIFGREAQQSILRGDGRVAEDTISWFQQVGTRFDPKVKDARRQLVIGNPWCHGDLTAWIKASLPGFSFETHDAEGGCCALHPAGKPILPSEWTIKLLHREKARLDANIKGDYEHFYRCKHILPGEQLFDTNALHFFKFKQSRPDLRLDDLRNILLLEHEPSDGEVVDDMQPGGLELRMIADPNHAKKAKRTEHVIWVVGYDVETMRIYLLDLWAEDSSYSHFVDMVYETAHRWHLDNFWLEEVGLGILAFYLKERQRSESKERGRTLFINEFSIDDSQAGMKNRIESVEPLMRERHIWAQRNQVKFIAQLESYPTGAIDTLDVLGNFPATIDIVTGGDDFLNDQYKKFSTRNVGQAGY